jgi:hypothetical protein
MNAIGRAMTCTFPVRTKRGTIVGITSVSKVRQTGHCKSMYWTIVTGAFALPSTFPRWGMPLKSETAEPASGSVLLADVVDGFDEEPPVKAKASAAATAASAIAPTAIASTFGEARRPPVLRSGGGAGVRRCFRAFFPLVTSGPR